MTRDRVNVRVVGPLLSGGVAGLVPVLLLCFLLANTVAAQDKPAENQEEQEQQLDPVVVTANLSERKQFKVGRSVEVVSAKRVSEKNPKSLPDLLDETPGVHVQKTNAGAGAPMIRGLIGPDNLILLDGVRMNNSTYRTGPNQYMALVDPWAMSRVEVLRGPGSVMYGSDAMGGVLNVIALDPRDLGSRLWGLTGRLSGASAYSGLGGTLQGDFTSGRYSGYVGGSFNHFGEVRAGGGESQPLSEYSRSSIREKFKVKLNERWSLVSALYWTAVWDAGRTDRLAQGRYRFYDNNDLTAYLRFERVGEGLFHRVRLNISYRHTNEEVTRYRCATAGGTVADRAACLTGELEQLTRKDRSNDAVHTPGIFATWEGRFFDQRLRLVLGGEGYFDFVSSEAARADADGDWEWKSRSRGNYSDGSRYYSLGAFLRGDVDLLKFQDSVIALDGGARLSYFDAAAPDVPGFGDVRYQHAGFVGSAGIKYLYREDLNLYLDYSQGFRAPNLQETTVMGDSGSFFEVPNDNLGPVSSDTLELGMKIRFPAMWLHMAGFQSWLDGLIDRETVPRDDWEEMGPSAGDVGGQTVKRRVNVNSGIYRGIEAMVRTVPYKGVSLWANLAWVRGEITDDEGNIEPARRVPPVSGAGGLRYEHDGLKLFAEFYVKWASNQGRLSPEDEEDLRICEDPNNPGYLLAECEGSPSWVTFNLRGGYSPADWIRINAVIENITDVRYKYHGSGIYAPGFNAMLEASLTY